ncbi:MAG: hypothetical protein IJ326_02555 [Lachnospiraceae bacterium]|nr:hypothetical protein [Lachnospiraceae bacterium]
MQLNKIGFLAAQMHAKQTARRRGMAKAVEYRENKAEESETTKEKDSTSSTGSSSSKQVQAYEVLEQAAAKVQEYAAKLKELGSKTEETDEKSFKEDAYDYIDKLVEAYNELYEEMQDMGDETNQLHCDKLSSICESYTENIAQLGITKEKDGTLTIDKEQAGNATEEKINACASWLQEISDRCNGIESGAAVSIKLWNSLYGTSSYDSLGTSSTYYGENGNWYSAIG